MYTLIIRSSSIKLFWSVFDEKFSGFHSNLNCMDVVDDNIAPEKLASTCRKKKITLTF